MGTTLGTIKALVRSTYPGNVTSDPAEVERTAKAFVAGNGARPITTGVLAAAKGSAVIPRRDYGPKQ